ncbi:SH3 domain-containing protein [Rossellomorea sp. H39__3]
MKREEVVHIKKIYISFLVICLLLPLFTSVKASAGGERVSIGVPTLNVRTGPGLSYPVLMQAAKGEEYTVTGNDGDWYKIDTPQGEGWVAEWLVTEGDSSDSPAAPEASGLTGTANEDSINVRKAPSTDSERLGTLSTGEEVSITGSVQGWYEISYRGGTAWINEDYLSLSGMESGSSDGSDSSMTATVNVESLLVRDEASLNGGIVGKVTRGESYSILEESNEWYRIKLSNGEDGWVAGWFMKVAGEEAEEKTEGTSMSEGAPDSITILYDGTNLRTSPDSQASVVERAGSGSTFDVVGTSGDWYEIRLSDGASAFVANWIVSSKKGGTSPAPETSGGLEGKTIVLDPGHGGRDGGTTGINGTHEKT